MPDEIDKQLDEAEALSFKMRPMLAHKTVGVQGAVLADLVSIFIIGHHPKLREETLAEFVATVIKLMPASEREIFGPGGFPGFPDHSRNR